MNATNFNYGWIFATLNYPLEIICILLTIEKLSATFIVMANVTGNAFMALVTDLIKDGFNKTIKDNNK